MRRLLWAAILMVVTAGVAAAQFAPPAGVALKDDPDEKTGTVAVVEWALPAELPPEGYLRIGFRVEIEQEAGKWFGDRRIGDAEQEVLKPAAIVYYPTATSIVVPDLSPWRKYVARVSAVYLPADAPFGLLPWRAVRREFGAYLKPMRTATGDSIPAADVPLVQRLSQPAAAQPAMPIGNWYALEKTNVLVWVLVYSVIVLVTIAVAQRHDIYIRPIAGLQAVNDAIGRATEMGRPILYITGLSGLSDIATIASMLVLGHLARRTAAYETPIIVPCYDPLVMAVEREIVRDAMVEAGKPQNYDPDNIFYVTDSQFGYVAAVDGIMVREKPAANFFMGYFYAESLILAETGASTGAIQIAGTDSDTQLPFFITACDYTLMGEELYAAGAYLSRNPLLIAQLRGQDIGKVLITLMLLVGAAAATCAATFPELSIFGSIVEWFATGG